MTAATLCICCGRPVYPTAPRFQRHKAQGKIHPHCWADHHSDPDGAWPVGHRCALDEYDEEAE